MTLWKAYQYDEDKKAKNDIYHFKPQLHDSSKQIWREFNCIAGANIYDTLKKFRRPGVVNWLYKLLKANIIDYSYIAKLETTAIIYKDSSNKPFLDKLYGMSYMAGDVISDSLSFHAQLLDELGEAWCNRVVMEIEKCDKAAAQVKFLYKNLQFSNGRKDKDAKTNQSGELDAQMRFYDSIDKPFRLWLEDLKAEYDLEGYSASFEKELVYIARRLGESLVAQTGSQAIFGRFSPHMQG